MGNTPTKSIHPERGSPEQEPDAADDESTNEEPDLQEAPADEEVAITPSTPTKPHKFDTNWSSNLAELIQYKSLHGSTSVPVKSKIYGSLGKWCENQRLSYHKGKLRPDRIEALKSAGFVFEGNIPRTPDRAYPSNIKRWHDHFMELQDFIQKFGHGNVPRSYALNPSLGKWVENVRCQYARGELSDQRIEELQSVGFEFVIQSSPVKYKSYAYEHQWEAKLQQLMEYKARYGDCHVLMKYDRELGKWCENQRGAYRKGQLSEERVEKLRNVGFSLEKRGRGQKIDRTAVV